MKRLALAAAGAGLAGLTACTGSAPAATPPGSTPPTPAGSASTVTPAGSTAVTNSPSAVTANCRQQYDAWKQGPGKGLVAALDAVGAAEAAGDMHTLKAVLTETKPALARASRHPLPACADPMGYWTVLMMHVSAAAASTGSAATLTAAMEGVPTLVRKLDAELKRAGG
jgi:hypothetical protein